MKMRKLIVWFAVLGLVAMTGCNRKTGVGIIGKDKVVSLAEINDNPKEYLNKECTVKGYVTAVKDIPLVKNDFFKIFDGTDELWIYTDRGVPPLYIGVMVKGIFRGVGDEPITLTLPIIKIQIKPEVQYGINLKEFEFL